MRKELKELIEKAEHVPCGYFGMIMIVAGEAYEGFFGANQYHNIIILGVLWNDMNKDVRSWKKICEYGDVLYIFDQLSFPKSANISLDIPLEYGVPRIWFGRPIYIDQRIPVSSIITYLKDGDA